MMELNQIVVSDALEFLNGLPDGCADCMVTSPPYNLRNALKGDLYGGWKGMKKWYDEHDDAMPNDEYIKWQQSILVEAWRVLRPTGAIFYNHKWRVQGGQLLKLGDEITSVLPVRQIIIWNRGNGFNWKETFFTPKYEVLYFIPKPDFELQPKANVYGDVWSITPESGSMHPAPFPIGIPSRCIQSSTKVGDLVIDPFAGSGTTPRAAQLLGRNYLACDLSPKYVEMARVRLSKPYAVPMFLDEADIEPEPTPTTSDMFGNWSEA